MVEKCYVMVKPGFTRNEIIYDTINAIKEKGIKLVDFAFIKYDDECARIHYIEKSGKPYVNDLINYISSDKSYGMVFEGENALSICRETVEQLRHTLKEKYNLDTDIMRNILHCSSKTKVGDTMLALDTQRELALYHYLKDKKVN